MCPASCPALLLTNGGGSAYFGCFLFVFLFSSAFACAQERLALHIYSRGHLAPHGANFNHHSLPTESERRGLLVKVCCPHTYSDFVRLRFFFSFGGLRETRNVNLVGRQGKSSFRFSFPSGAYVKHASYVFPTTRILSQS